MSAPQEWDEQLDRLYQWQLEELKGQEATDLFAYLAAHCSTLNAISRQTNIVRRYLPYVGRRVLDWGCMHAPDACLLRMSGDDDRQLFGCDLCPPGLFPIFHDFAGLQYEQLRHPWQLPYPDESFDTIISDGVLEHVPNDQASLTELYRVLQPGGHLIICCLPNRWSATEMLARTIGLPHHLRTYGMGQTHSLLLHHGFLPLTSSFYQMMPSLSGLHKSRHPYLTRAAQWLWKLNPLLERIWPLNRLASNLFVVSRKCHTITWTEKAELSSGHPSAEPLLQAG